MKTRNLTVPLFACLILPLFTAAQSSYYGGSQPGDSIMKAIDNRLKESPVKTDRGRLKLGTDSLLFYAREKATGQLLALALTDKATDSRTMYDLKDGELLRVRYLPEHRKGGAATIYYFDKGKVLYIRERNTDTPPGEKFVADLLYFKQLLGAR